MADDKEKDVIAKVTGIDNVSQSQMDRFSLYDAINDELHEFMRTQMESVTSKSVLRQSIEDKILQRVLEEEDREISTNHLIKLLEIMSKTDSDIAINLVNILKENQRIVIENLINVPQGNGKKPIESEFSAEETQTTKKILKSLEFISNLKKTEFDKEEKK
jgi:hypothetical protein